MAGIDTSQVRPFGQSLNRFAKQKALDQIAITGRSLPCHVTEVISAGIVEVAFDVTAASGQTPITIPSVIVPILGWQWMLAPIQVGSLGTCLAADVYLGGVSGLGGGTATLTQPMNLDGLLFCPLGNTAWPTALGSTAINPNQTTIYGPEGVLLADQSGASTVTITPTSIKITAGGKTLEISSAGITLDGILWETHVHPGVESGTATTGAPEA